MLCQDEAIKGQRRAVKCACVPGTPNRCVCSSSPDPRSIFHFPELSSSGRKGMFGFRISDVFWLKWPSLAIMASLHIPLVPPRRASRIRCLPCPASPARQLCSFGLFSICWHNIQIGWPGKEMQTQRGPFRPHLVHISVLFGPAYPWVGLGRASARGAASDTFHIVRDRVEHPRPGPVGGGRWAEVSAFDRQKGKEIWPGSARKTIKCSI